MEAAFFAIDIIGIVLLLYWSIMNDKLGPDAPSVGLFAYRETIRGPAPPRVRGQPSPPPRRDY